jgi:two-component system, NarL family, nitrate/nitrite response regulator NarL
MTLPAFDAVPTVNGPVSMVAPPLRIALLEDERAMRESLAEALKAHGMEVTTQSGESEEFLRSVAENPPDVALIDLVLSHEQVPRDAGRRVAEALRGYHPKVRTVVLSGVLDTHEVERCLASGIAGFLPKQSIGIDEVLSAVKAVARGERVFFSDFAHFAESHRTASRPLVFGRLTEREFEVLQYVSGGAENSQIAAHLGITERTVKAHISKLYEKLDTTSRIRLVLMARQHGVHSPVEL